MKSGFGFKILAIIMCIITVYVLGVVIYSMVVG